MITRKITWNSILQIILFLLPFFPSNLELFNTSIYRSIYIFGFLLIVIRDGKIRRIPFERILIVFLCVMSIPLVINSDYTHLIFQFTDIVFPLYIGYYSCKKTNNINQAIDNIITAGVILSLLGIFEAATGNNVFDKFFGLETVRYAANDYRFGIARAYGTFGTSIDFCLYLSIVLVLIVYRLSESNKHKYIVSYIICMISAIATLSRGILAFIFIFHFIYAIHYKLFKRKIVYFAIAFIVLILLGLIAISDRTNVNVFDVIAISIGTIFQTEKYSSAGVRYGLGGASERLSLFTWVFDRIRNEPWIGNGFSSQFSVQINEWKVKTSIENYYLYILYCSGLIGISAYASLIFGLIKKVRTAMNDVRTNIEYLTLTEMIMFFLCIFTVSPKQEFSFFFAVIGMLFRIISNEPTRKSFRKNRDRMNYRREKVHEQD